MADRTPEVQKAVVAALKANAGVTALVGSRVYDRPPQDVTYPYLRIGDALVAPFDGDELRGSEIVMPIHCWVAGPCPVEARLLAKAVVAAMHWSSLSLDAGAAVFVRWSSTRDQPDPDDVRRQAIVDLEILTDG